MKAEKKKEGQRRVYHTVHKIRRTFTAFLPPKKTRCGECARCGECCKMGWTCPFLKYVQENGKRLAACSIRPLRPMNCRTYPRTRGEQLVHPCGFYFVNGKEEVKSDP